jgi:hypothetical protein
MSFFAVYLPVYTVAVVEGFTQTNAVSAGI